MDKGLSIFDLTLFDGDPLKDTVVVLKDMGEFLYGTVQDCGTTATLPLRNYQEIKSHIDTLKEREAIPIVMLDLTMNQIRPDVFTNNLLTYSNEQFYDVPNRPESPYQEGHLFYNYVGLEKIEVLDPTFILDTNFVFNNGSAWETIEMDFDDGEGYQTVSLNTPIEITYRYYGFKRIRTRILTNNVVKKFCQTVIKLEEADILIRTFQQEPDAIFSEVEVPELEEITLNVWYNDKCSNVIKKPLIFIEGFDAAGCTGSDEFWDEIDAKYTLPNSDKFLHEELQEGGYDLIYINFESRKTVNGEIDITNNGADDIEENAARTLSAIKWINAQKALNGSKEQNVVIGASMGGIIGKLVHLQMEAEGYDHQSRIFISFDSPLRGANFPMGFQAMVKRLAQTEILGVTLGEKVEELGTGYSDLSSPAARNQFIYHIDGVDIGSPSYFHNDFYSVFDQYGQLEVEHVAIANASEDNEGMLYGPSALLLDFQINNTSIASLMGNVDPGFEEFLLELGLAILKTNISLDQKIWAYPGNSDNEVYRGKIKILKLPTILPFPFPPVLIVRNHSLEVPQNWMNLDVMPGGMREFTSVASCRDKGEGFPFTPLYSSFCFVPKFSSLDQDINDPTNNGNVIPHANNELNFYWKEPGATEPKYDDPPQQNEEHIYFTPRNVQFMVYSFMTENPISDSENELEGNIYNFGKGVVTDWDVVVHPDEGVVRRSTSDIIDESLTISGDTELWINRDGRIGYVNVENNAFSENADFFRVDLTLGCDIEPTVLDIKDGGQVVVGENPGDDKGHLVVNDMTSIQVSRNGLLRVNKNSKLIIKSGGYVTVEEKGKLQANGGGKIIVQNGGVLEIMSDASLKADWYSQIVVEPGGKLILHGDAITDVSHSGKIDIKGELVIKDDFTFKGDGRFRFYSTHKLTLENDWHFLGIGRNITAIEVVSGSIMTGDKNIRLAQMTVESSGMAAFAAEDAPTFRVFNVTFRGNEGASMALDFKGDIDVRVFLSKIENFDIGISLTGNKSFSGCKVLMSEVNNCEYGIGAEDVKKISVSESTFNGMEQGEYGMILSNVKEAQVTGSKISNFSNSGFFLLQVQGLFLNGSRVYNNGNGIWSPGWAGANVFLQHNTDIYNNGIGVHLEQGIAQTSTNLQFGVLLVDCAKIRDNEVGVVGNDITLQVDALVNCGNCPIEESAPNHFENEKSNFEICLSDELMTSVLARGNYWGAEGPKGLDITNGSDCSKAVSVNTEFATTVNAESCIMVNVIDPKPAKIDDCVMKSSGKPKNVYAGYGKAYAQFRRGNYEAALPHFKSVAGIDNKDRKYGTPICKTYIDVARAITRSLSDDKATVAFNTFSDDFELEQVVASNKTSLYPNPAKDEVTVSYDFAENAERFDRSYINHESSGTINIYNAVGVLIYQSPLVEKQTIDTRNWSNGLYLVRLLDAKDNLITTEKLMITK